MYGVLRRHCHSIYPNSGHGNEEDECHEHVDPHEEKQLKETSDVSDAHAEEN